ncbi:MAG: hypothetical protein CMN29_22175, partial [Sandaracinus sp.]|nr:hypothetical protein [Sandaracinus sp.]
RRRARASAEPAPVEEGEAPAARPGIDLRDRDVLLISVDALRADRLAAWGGEGLTPEMDALAEEGLVFRRAYTPTPHTSYALSSMLTGKYLREVLELPDAPEAHPALPELLRRYGYRTAAFYPPAIFFVDGHRFAALEQGGFGFEYRKKMFASAGLRVAQLERYLREVEPGHPLFVWVHLFEPHEPYDPPEGFARGDSTEARYDGEVAAADAAIGDLVRAFREARPDATIILTADHGEEFGDHGGYYHGTTLYDEQVRVPLVWSSPEEVPPGETDVPVELLDVATTLLAAVGIPRDARMRGDDLGPVLRGDAREPGQPGAPEAAFAAIGDERMVVDGRYKLICAPTGCRLFDLEADPVERRNLAGEEPRRVEHLRGTLSGLLESIPRVEAMAMGAGRAWPEALARAELGDATAADAVVPLLGDERAEVRAAAARVLGQLAHAPAEVALARLRSDADPRVRGEAVVAGLRLGDAEARAPAQALLEEEGLPEELRRRAALGLAERGDGAGVTTLRALAMDEGAEEGARLDALEALRTLAAAGVAPEALGESVPALGRVLEDVRLRPAAVRALGAIGGRRAADAIAAAFEEERYLPARAAEAAALFALGDRRAEPLARRYLGMDTPFPGGVGLLLEHGALARPSGAGASLEAGSVRVGSWRCEVEGCLPLEGAKVRLPRRGAPADPARVVVLADGEGVLRVGDERFEVRGPTQVSLEAPAGPERELTFAGSALVRALVVVPAREELPPPPPEPWEAEEDQPAGASSGEGAPSSGSAPAGASEPEASSAPGASTPSPSTGAAAPAGSGSAGASAASLAASALGGTGSRPVR